MPVYDYECRACGIFTALRPMAESGDPLGCPDCGVPAPRAFVVAPALAGMDSSRRNAFAINERAAHEPKLSSAHGSNCSCCGPSRLKQKSKTAKSPGGAKSFPSARPWMISH